MKTLLLALAGAGLMAAQSSNVVTDNDQVKVLKVVVQPHQKTKLHEHKVNRVMIYLQPGKQDFAFSDGKKTTITWQKNEAKWSPAGGMHIAEVTTPKPVTIVEIELTQPGHAPAPNALDPVKLDPKHYQVAMENDQVRVLRVKIGAGESAPMHKHALNRVVVYLTDQKVLSTTEDGKETTVEKKAGDVAWAGLAQHKEKNVGTQAFELYAVELKE